MEAGEIQIDTHPRRGKARVVSIDGHDVRTTSIEALVAARIESGDRMTADKLDLLLGEVEAEAATARALRLLGHRERSPGELSNRLTDDGYPAHVVRDVVARMDDIGAVDEGRFSESYVRAKMASGWGRERIIRGLRSAGIDPDRASALVEREAPEARELDRALMMLPDDPPRDRRERERLLRRLVSRGFSYDVALSAIEHRSRHDDDRRGNRFES